MRKRARRFCVAAALAGLACCMALGAGEEEQLTPMERMHLALLDIQHHITASNAKLDLGLTGASPRVTDGGTEHPATPAESCCIPHIDRITKEIRGLIQIMDQLDLWYAEQNYAEARARLGPIRTELITVARGMAVFKMVGSKPRAKEALQGLIRPFNRLRKAIEELEACCPLEQAADGRWRAKAPDRTGS